MKKALKISLTVAIFLSLTLFSLAQSPPHPNGGGGPGGGNTPVGGGAPLGEGIILLLTMGIGYGVRKYRQVKKLL